MKKRTLFVAGMIAFGTLVFTACSDDLVSQDEELFFTASSDTLSGIISEPVRVVSIDEAREELENILSEIDLSISKSGNVRKISSEFTLSSSKRSLRKSSGDADTVETQIYVFNFDNDEGFAFMSTTTATPSLLALIESGNIDTTKEINNPGLIMFLENLESYLSVKNDTIIDFDNSSNFELSKKYRKTIEYNFYSPRGGYCKVHWGQWSPYNNYCAYYSNGDTPAGCVAIALGQLLSTYKYPETYKGYVYNWNNMINGYDDDKIAVLISKINMSENLMMSYGNPDKNEGSGSTIDRIPITLQNLGFTSGGSVVSYDIEKVINEIKKGNSVIASGYAHVKNSEKKILGIRVSKTTYRSGYDWLIHGAFTLTTKIYSSHSNPKNKITVDNYVLCNMGWYGSNDGYYLSAVFDTNKPVAYNENFYASRLSKSQEADNYYQYKLKILINVIK